jgi:acyl-CoA synthetase (AMP-forming)/AMP-acid ligase II
LAVPQSESCSGGVTGERSRPYRKPLRNNRLKGQHFRGLIASVLIILKSVVFGIPDEDYGEALPALVEPMPGATLTSESIRSFLALHLANYKVPWHVELRASLPRKDTGKIFKHSLREPYWRSAGRAV